MFVYEKKNGSWMKRLWFTQQRPVGYMPLKAGLGIITVEELREYGIFHGSAVKAELLKYYKQKCKSLTDFPYTPEMLCPKTYTTRSHRLTGNYHVVEGSRYKDEVYPISPEIALTAICRGQLDLRNRTLDGSPLLFPNSFAAADLGIRNATFEDLISVILNLNKSNTIDTKFYVNRLFPVENVSNEPETIIKTGTEVQNMQEQTYRNQSTATVYEQKLIADWVI